MTAAKIDHLHAIADVARSYVLGGRFAEAQTLYRGLVAIDPSEAAFALGLGVALDRLGDEREAERWYARAAKLDATDARPDVNRAELHLAHPRGRRTAAALLKRAIAKAQRAEDRALRDKAADLLRTLQGAVE
jgi:Flp pilus assembly protein TadD